MPSRRGVSSLERGAGAAAARLPPGYFFGATPDSAGGGLSEGIGATGDGGTRSSGALGACAGLAAAPVAAGRNSGPFWPQAASNAIAHRHTASAPRRRGVGRPGRAVASAKTATDAGGRRAAKLDPGHSFI